MSKFTDRLATKGVVVNDPSNVLTTLGTDASIDGLWQQIQQSKRNYLDPISDPYDDNLVKLEKKMQILELQYTLLRLKVLGMEGKFTQEEVANIRKMIMSEDEASRTLANTIIENA